MIFNSKTLTPVKDFELLDKRIKKGLIKNAVKVKSTAGQSTGGFLTLGSAKKSNNTRALSGQGPRPAAGLVPKVGNFMGRANSYGANEFPNNTQALAMGNLSNMQQLQKQQLGSAAGGGKPKKILIIKQKRSSSGQAQLRMKNAESLPKQYQKQCSTPSNALSTPMEFSDAVAPGQQASLVRTYQDAPILSLNFRNGGPSQALEEKFATVPCTELKQPLYSGITDGPMGGATAAVGTTGNSAVKRVAFEQPKPTMEQLEENRRQNSQRQMVIRKGADGAGGARRHHRVKNQGIRGQRGIQKENPLMRVENGSLFSCLSLPASNFSAPTAPLDGLGSSMNLKGKASGFVKAVPPQENKLMMTSKTGGFFKTSSGFGTGQGLKNGAGIQLKIQKKNANGPEKGIAFQKTMTNGFNVGTRSLSSSSLKQNQPNKQGILQFKQVKLQPYKMKDNLKFKPPLPNKQKAAGMPAKTQSSPEINFTPPQPTSVEEILEQAGKLQASLNNRQQISTTALPRQLPEHQPSTQLTAHKAQLSHLAAGTASTENPQQKISSNFNLSFNNSFNTSYTNSQNSKQKIQGQEQQPVQPRPGGDEPARTESLMAHGTLAFQLSKESEEEGPGSAQENQQKAMETQVYEGFITKDAIVLEQQLTDDLKDLQLAEGSKSDRKRVIQTLGRSFDEVIKRDKNFGRLLTKIKQAYDEYLGKLAEESSSHEATKAEESKAELKALEGAKEEELREVVARADGLRVQLDTSQRTAKRLAEEIVLLKTQLTQKQEDNQQLEQKLSALLDRQWKDVGVQTVPEVNQTAKNWATADLSVKSGSGMGGNGSVLHLKGGDMSLSLSNQSAIEHHRSASSKADPTTALNLKASMSADPQAGVQRAGHHPDPDNVERMREDMNKLAQQNRELNEACATMDEEIHYRKLREQKIMYLVHLMQNKGYPVQNMYEQELKQVHTWRIQEFLDSKEKEMYEMEHGGPELDEKYHFSFHTDDSFEPIADGPMLRPLKPDVVPLLNLEGLPEYETSSEEDEEEEEEMESQQARNPYQRQADSHPARDVGPLDSGLSMLQDHQPASNGQHEEISPFHYQESMKYISEFYEKYRGQSQPREGQNDEEEDEEYSGAFEDEYTDGGT